MKLINHLKQAALLLGVVVACHAPTALAADEEYSFKVHNKTEHKIKSVLVSEDKKSWGKFNIGDGIGAGKTVKLVWDKATNNENCKQWVKAVFDDGDESKVAKFDFCEEDLEIEFEE